MILFILVLWGASCRFSDTSFSVSLKNSFAFCFASCWLVFPVQQMIPQVIHGKSKPPLGGCARLKQTVLSSRSRIAALSLGQMSVHRLGRRSGEGKERKKHLRGHAHLRSPALACSAVHTGERPGLASICVAVKAYIPVPPINLPPHQCTTCLPAPFSFEHIF